MNRLITFTAALIFFFTSCNNSSEESVKAGKLNDTIKAKQINTMDKNYTASISINNTATNAYNAIKNFRGWWSEDIEGNTDKLNEEFFYHYQDVHLCKIRLIEMVPDKKLVYQVVDNQFNFTKDKSEWKGTKLVFDILESGNQTKVLFTHEGLTPSYECYNVCSDAWSKYIKISLKNLIDTGKGEPNPKGKEGEINKQVIEKWKLKSS